MMYVRYFASVFAWQFLNPFGIWQSILQNGGQAIAVLRSRISRLVAPDISMSLPFSGYWTVARGGVEESASHSWNVIAQRYAYDFVLPGEDGKRYKGNGKKACEYYGFGRDVLAPADGTVIKVRNNIRDYAHAGTASIDILTPDLRGNYVVIRHAKHVYSLIAHLRKGSCMIQPGDLVTRGQVIGQCGNSGHSTEPHIHFHLQDRQNFYVAAGLPVLFKNVAIRFKASQITRKLRHGYISSNSRVRNLAPGEESSAEAHETVSEIPPAKGSLFSLITSVLNVLGLITWLALLYMLLIGPLLAAGRPPSLS